MANKIVIVGAGHAAGQVVATLKQKKYEGNICLIGEEAYLPYQRPPLSKKYLAGELPAGPAISFRSTLESANKAGSMTARAAISFLDCMKSFGLLMASTAINLPPVR